MFEKVRKFFKLKLYTMEQVRHFREKGIITQEQFAEITGEE